MENMVEVIINNVSTAITMQKFSEYQNNPNYRIIMESGKYKILEKMNG